MYRRAAPMQASLALVGTTAAFLAWLSGSDVAWLVGALLFGFVVPFTIFVIKPVNDRLLVPDLDRADPGVAMLLRRWVMLHLARSSSSAFAFLLFLFSLAAD